MPVLVVNIFKAYKTSTKPIKGGATASKQFPKWTQKGDSKAWNADPNLDIITAKAP